MVEKVNIAIVGTGFFGEFHTRAFSENSMVDVKAIVDLDEDRAKEVAEHYRVGRWYTSIDEMLVKEDIDAVSIATPEQYHREPTVAAAKAGKHIFVETGEDGYRSLEVALAIIELYKTCKRVELPLKI